MVDNLKRKTATAFVWSAIQSWVGKFFTLLVFLILARFLTPEELGMATTVTIVLAFVAIVSEQGFPEAIIQRKNLLPEDLNLPFLISIAMALLSSYLLIIFSKDIAHLLKADATASLIMYSAVIPPLAIVTSFEVAMRKKIMDFKSLSKAYLRANFFAGIFAITLAIANFGALSLVAQVIATSAIMSEILWRTRIWSLGIKINTSKFKDILSYSSYIFVSKLISFFSGKVMDFIILGKYGVTALGLYTVGSKIFYTVLQLLGSTIYDVSLAAFSSISDDTDRLRRIYLRFMFLASCTTLPVFVLLSVLSSEICDLMFNDKWDGAAQVMQWLCLLGSVEVLKFFNFSVLAATGNSRSILFLNIITVVVGFSTLLFYEAESIGTLTLYYVTPQILFSPISFWLAMRATTSSLRHILQQILPGIFFSGIAYYAIYQIRLSHVIFGMEKLERLEQLENIVILGSIFFIVVFTLLWLCCSKKLATEMRYIFSAYAKR